MKALLCTGFGPPESLVIREVERIAPAAGKVVIAVRACGINFPDALIIENKYQFKPELPFSPGGEVAGVITAVGAGVQGWLVGDEVIAFLLWGGLAEEVATDAGNLMPKPEGMSFEEAAGFLVAYGTAFHALCDRGGLKAGETLLVLGAAGGVGTAAIQIGKGLGARVIAATSSETKNNLCRDLGADACIDYSTGDMKGELRELTRNEGVNMVFDPVGGPISEVALRSIAWKGRYMVLGFASGEIPKIPLNLVLLKGAAIIGVFWGAFFDRDAGERAAHLAGLRNLYDRGLVHPHISAVYPLTEAAQAIRDLRDRRATGKVVVTIT